MAIITNDYRLAVGLNNTAGLTLFTSLTDANSVAFIEPYAVPFYTRGLKRVKSNGVAFRSGYKVVQWQVGAMTVAQWTTLTGTYEGNVTVRTTTGTALFANYNAVLTLPDPNELEYGFISESWFNGGAYLNVKLNFAIIGTA